MKTVIPDELIETPLELLSVGGGRGVFLFPFLRKFPWAQVVSLNLLQHCVALRSSRR